MVQAQQNGNVPVQQIPTEPRVLSAQEDYIECLNTCNTFLKQFNFPKQQMVAPRLENLITCIRVFVQNIMAEECSKGVPCTNGKSCSDTQAACNQ